MAHAEVKGVTVHLCPHATNVDDVCCASMAGQRSFDEKELESAYDEERRDGPGLHTLGFERICCCELLLSEVWVTKGTGNSSTTTKSLAYV